MGSLAYTKHGEDPGAWARKLKISKEAVEIYLSADVIDLHVDSFIWHRTFGLPLGGRPNRGILGGRFYGQVDFARVREANITGATWVITTNPLRSAAERARAFVENLARLRALFEDVRDEFEVVTNVAQYRAARAAGRHGAFLGIQGGNALDRDLEALDLIPEGLILRITLVHLTSSRIGSTSAPLGRIFSDGLTPFGRDFVRRLEEKKILVDLAHVSKRGFWDAVDAHDRTRPLLVSHTGVDGVYAHWRNLDDAQLRAVADSGGTVGIMYHAPFLGQPHERWKVEKVVHHLEHLVRVVGDDFASLGSDWDGAILPPRDMPTCLELPVLVERMLARGWKPESIRKVLGGNFLRVVEALRGS